MSYISYKIIIQLLLKINQEPKKYLPVGAALIDVKGQIHYSLDNTKDHCERLFPKKAYYQGIIIVNLEPCPDCLFFLAKSKVKMIIF